MTVALAVVPEQPRPEDPADVAAKPVGTARGLVVGASLTTIGVLLLGFLAHLLLLSNLSEQRDQALLRDDLRTQVRLGTAPVALPIAAGTPVAELTVPRLQLDAVVVQGTTSADLRHGPGHRASSPLPGQAGVTVVAGRKSAYGGPFAHLDRLRVGDLISATTGQGRFTFQVDDIRHTGFPASLPPGDARLQLVTSEPAWTPDRVLVVSAVLVRGTLQPAATGLPRPTAAELALRGETDAAVPTAAWSAALLLLAIAGALAWQRLSRPLVWLGTLPLAAALLWQLADAVARLLPSTL
jgi:LPXTG-site transpeptidase (sortase) family protein